MVIGNERAHTFTEESRSADTAGEPEPQGYTGIHLKDGSIKGSRWYTQGKKIQTQKFTSREWEVGKTVGLQTDRSTSRNSNCQLQPNQALNPFPFKLRAGLVCRLPFLILLLTPGGHKKSIPVIYRESETTTPENDIQPRMIPRQTIMHKWVEHTRTQKTYNLHSISPPTPKPLSSLPPTSHTSTHSRFVLHFLKERREQEVPGHLPTCKPCAQH